jgi:hypothetical protein
MNNLLKSSVKFSMRSNNLLRAGSAVGATRQLNVHEYVRNPFLFYRIKNYK